MFSPIAIAIVTVFMVPSPSSSHAHPVHELHVTATRFAFKPSIIQVVAGEAGAAFHQLRRCRTWLCDA